MTLAAKTNVEGRSLDRIRKQWTQKTNMQRRTRSVKRYRGRNANDFFRGLIQGYKWKYCINFTRFFTRAYIDTENFRRLDNARSLCSGPAGILQLKASYLDKHYKWCGSAVAGEMNIVVFSEESSTSEMIGKEGYIETCKSGLPCLQLFTYTQPFNTK